MESHGSTEAGSFERREKAEKTKDTEKTERERESVSKRETQIKNK